ncbi:hypothetical protein JCM10212_000194 [Sporobolomyces blumeae]
MGFKPGEALGKKQDERTESSPGPSRNQTGGGGGLGFAKASFAPAASTKATSEDEGARPVEDAPKRSTEPIKFEIRTGRTGLGIPQARKPRLYPSASAPGSTSLAPDEVDDTPLPDLSSFLAHIRSTMDDKRAYGILRSCRRTLEELDRKVGGIEDNPMWRDPDEEEREERKVQNRKLFDRIDKELESDQEGEGGKATDGGRREVTERTEMDYVKGISGTVVELEEEAAEREREFKKAQEIEKEQRRVERLSRARDEAEEEEEWFAIDVKTRLALTLSYLRNHYHYCFWCGCQYESAQDMQENCPGTEEDDH